MSAARGPGPRRRLRDARTRTITFADAVRCSTPTSSPSATASAYPTLADRLAFAHGLGTNKALRLFYG